MASKPHPPITLYRGFPNPNTYTWSPFVTKLEARLRFAQLPYRPDIGSVFAAPRGKIPYIELSSPKSGTGQAGDNRPTLLGDSTLIIEALVSEGALPDLEAGLSAEQRAVDLALRALLEEKLYFYDVHERWHNNYYAMRDHVLQSIPYLLRVPIGLYVQWQSSGIMRGQGTARYTDAELTCFRTRIWESFDALLVEARSKSRRDEGRSGEVFWVLGGRAPTEADAALFGFVVSTLVCFAVPEARNTVMKQSAVMDYARRIHNRYFPDVEWPGDE